MPELHIQLLGEFRLVSADTHVSQISSPRLQALLAYLLLHRHAPQPRHYLAFLLWPDTSEAQARTNLRQLLHALKHSLPEADQFVHADAQTLQWRSDAPFRLDVAEFEQTLTQAAAAEQTGDLHALRVALEQASAVHQGDLLPGCYDDWIVPERERLRQALTEALERLLLLLEREGQPREAIPYAQRLVRHDPLREETYRALMHLYAACGDRAGALRVYHTCATVLERELAVEPSAATRQAYEHLVKVEVQARPVPPPQPANTNLPVPLTSFVGREVQMTEVRRLLQTSRLLTLTGPGGCGKTRLALEAATNLLDDYPDGVWWVELAAISDPSLVPQAVATALGVRDQSGRTLLETLVDYLRAKQMLVLLDNCEHLVEACAQLAEQWLSACPHLHILATSREALRVGGETTWPVPSLSLPEAQPPSTVEELMRSEAIRLFVERAAMVLPTFRLTAANAPLVAQICRRLDGLPLAIELAAARVKVLTAEQIAARLDDVFHLLTAGRRTALLRHQTLRAAIDWSYALLSERERVLFRGLAVFAGGWTLEAAETVCAGAGLEAGEVLDVLSHVVDKSLVTVSQNGETRYRLLETIREYALEKFVASGEEASLRQRHATYYLALAEEAEPRLDGPERAMWLGRLEQEHDNLRAALAWSQAAGKVELGLQLVCALRLFWCEHGHLQEAWRWLEAALAPSSVDVPRSLRAVALNSASIVSRDLGEYARAQELAEESLALFREDESTAGIAWALESLGDLAMVQDDTAQASVLAEERLALHQELRYQWGIANDLADLGQIAHLQGDDARATALFDDSLARFRELEDKAGIAWVLCLVGEIIHCQGDNLRAVALFEEGLTLFRELENKGHIPWALGLLARAVHSQGDDRRAIGLFQESLQLSREQGDKPGMAGCLEGLAGIAAMHGQPIRATRLFAAGVRLRETIGGKLHRRPIDGSEYDRTLDITGAQLDTATFAAVSAEGQAMTLEEAIADALSLRTEE